MQNTCLVSSWPSVQFLVLQMKRTIYLCLFFFYFPVLGIQPRVLVMIIKCLSQAASQPLFSIILVTWCNMLKLLNHECHSVCLMGSRIRNSIFYRNKLVCDYYAFKQGLILLLSELDKMQWLYSASYGYFIFSVLFKCFVSSEVLLTSG